MAEMIVGGLVVLVDEDDLETVQEWRWFLHRSGHTTYVRGYRPGDSRSRMYMHRLLTAAEKTEDVDHINGNGLDNRRANLRRCSRSENNANRHRSQSRSSPFKGVHKERGTGRYRAEIHWRGTRYTLGRFQTAEEARSAYLRKAHELFGDFANPAHG